MRSTHDATIKVVKILLYLQCPYIINRLGTCEDLGREQPPKYEDCGEDIPLNKTRPNGMPLT